MGSRPLVKSVGRLFDQPHPYSAALQRSTLRITRTPPAPNVFTRSRASVSSRIPQGTVEQTLTLTSWNVNAFSPRPVARAGRILDHILQRPVSPDIVFLQEVTLDARASLLSNPRVRDGFFATDAEGETSFDDVPFGTMTLLSRARFASRLDSRKEGDGTNGERKILLGKIFRVTLPSEYRRDALCVDILSPTSPGTVLRLINVHLDSLKHNLPNRIKQMEILAGILREPGCSGGIIAGDFNAISPEDERLIGDNKLVDGWVALHGKTGPSGATWGVGVRRRDGLHPGRLDRVAMRNLKTTEMEVLRPGSIAVPRPGEKDVVIPLSDHCGLRCVFTI